MVTIVEEQTESELVEVPATKAQQYAFMAQRKQTALEFFSQQSNENTKIVPDSTRPGKDGMYRDTKYANLDGMGIKMTIVSDFPLW